MSIEIIWIDHIYIAVSDLNRSERFYGRMMKHCTFEMRYATRQGASRPNASLRRQLLEMCEEHQIVRQDFSPNVSAETVAKIEAVDARHLRRMTVIVAQYGWPGGKFVLHPIEDADHVDERRRAVGLPPMAEQEKAMREVYR